MSYFKPMWLFPHSNPAQLLFPVLLFYFSITVSLTHFGISILINIMFAGIYLSPSTMPHRWYKLQKGMNLLCFGLCCIWSSWSSIWYDRLSIDICWINICISEWMHFMHMGFQLPRHCSVGNIIISNKTKG